MKKIIEVLVVLLFLVGTVFALENRANNDSQENETTTIQITENKETQEEIMERKKEDGFFSKIVYFFKCTFSDMKESAKAQHEVDKANFEAVKAESKANFEENRFQNTFERAKQNSKESWENAKAMSNQETRKAMEQEKRDEAIKAANERKLAAEKRYEEAKK